MKQKFQVTPNKSDKDPTLVTLKIKQQLLLYHLLAHKKHQPLKHKELFPSIKMTKNRSD